MGGHFLSKHHSLVMRRNEQMCSLETLFEGEVCMSEQKKRQDRPQWWLFSVERVYMHACVRGSWLCVCDTLIRESCSIMTWNIWQTYHIFNHKSPNVVCLQMVNPLRMLGEVNWQMLLVIIENSAKGCSQLSHLSRKMMMRVFELLTFPRNSGWVRGRDYSRGNCEDT